MWKSLIIIIIIIHSNFSERPSADVDAKNSHGVNNNNHNKS